MSVLILFLQVGAAIGFGAMLLRALGLLQRTTPAEQWTMSFIFGMGLIGWFGFWLGVFGLLKPFYLWAMLIAGLAGLPLLAMVRPAVPPNRLFHAGLLGLLALVLLLDLIEALPPPTDADTIAYHFALAKLFVNTGGLIFIPRAVDGAVPLLLQMTYVPVLALGGETALTLWTMVSGWSLGLCTYVLARRWLDPTMSLLVALATLTLPTVLYGGGSGQIETRTACFVCACAWALMRLRTEPDKIASWAAAAGFAAGFFVGAKYLGLLFGAASAITLIVTRPRPTAIAAFALASILGGFQWYAWNWHNTGDPLFPLLYRWLPSDPSWTAAHDAVFQRDFYPSEQAVPQTLAWLFAYPFWATLSPADQIESGRVGFGPLGLFLLPIALLGAWTERRRILTSPLMVMLLLVGLNYLLWWFTSSSQRLRHLLPLMPLLLILLVIPARRLAGSVTALRTPLIAAFGVTLAFQIALQSVFTANAIQFLRSGESRQAFLDRVLPDQIPLRDIARLIDPNKSKVMIFDRHIAFYADFPVFLGHVLHAPIVELHPDLVRPASLFAAMENQGITHLLAHESGMEGRLALPAIQTLLDSGCLRPIRHWSYRTIASRTLPEEGSTKGVRLLALQPSCPMTASRATGGG